MPLILVVDDDAGISALLRDILEFNGHEVHTAANGVEALTQMRQRRADLIMLDLMMPVMDGWEFLHECGADPGCRSVPVVIMSAVAGMAGRPGLCRRVKRVLHKPFDMTAVEDIVAEIVGR